MGPLLPGHGRVFSSASHFNHLATATRFQLRNTGLHQPRKTKLDRVHGACMPVLLCTSSNVDAGHESQKCPHHCAPAAAAAATLDFAIMMQLQEDTGHGC
eukprot:scaffold26511_cov16-Tisochrysis_lutea.AAC.1